MFGSFGGWAKFLAGKQIMWIDLLPNSSVDTSLVSFEGTKKNALAWEVDAVVHELP